MFEYFKKDFDLCGPVDHKAGFQLVGIECHWFKFQ